MNIISNPRKQMMLKQVVVRMRSNVNVEIFCISLMLYLAYSTVFCLQEGPLV
jgi:cell division protein FtsB